MKKLIKRAIETDDERSIRNNVPSWSCSHIRNLLAAAPLIVSCTSIGLLGAWVYLEVEKANNLALKTSKEVREMSKEISRRMAEDREQHAKDWAEAAGETE